MAGVQLIDNFSYRGRKFLDGRQHCDSLESMRSIDESSVPDGFMAYCAETKIWYSFDSSLPFDPVTGYWRPFAGYSQSDPDDIVESISESEIDNLFNSLTN